MADPGLNPHDYEDVDIDDADNPEWTEEDFAAAKSFKEVLPELYAQWLAERSVSLTLSPSTIAAFAEEGDDWKERMAAALDAAAQAKRAA